MLNWLAKAVVKKIDIGKLADLVEVKLAERLDKRLNSKLKKYVIVPLNSNRPKSSTPLEEKPDE